MREIDNKIGFGAAPVKPEVKKVEEAPSTKQAAEETNNKQPQQQSLKELDSAAAVGGRSQVTETSEAAATEKAVAFGTKHPQVIVSADKAFDKFYNELSAKGDPEAYPKAAAMTDIYVKEFLMK